jgi:coenzyme F420-reducing hydrogenase delta subunit
MFILKGFQRGFDGVIVLGCHPGDCHYAKGNYYTRRRIPLVKNLIQNLGIPEERFHFEWVSASEGYRFAELVTDFTQKLYEMGPFGKVGECND